MQLLLVLLATLLITRNSYLISIEIGDLIYSISSSYLFILILTIFLIIFLIQSFYFKAKFRYNQYKINKFLKNKNKGYSFFVNGMIALANKDYKNAISESKKISNKLDDNNSLTLLLKSEIYKVEKKYDKLKLIYEEMAKNKNTENLAFRGMMEQYIYSQDYHHAFIYGEKLFYRNPYIDKIYDALLNIVSKTNNWQQLIPITEKAYSSKIISKKIYQENKSIAYFEIAKIKGSSQIKESTNYMEKALNLRKNFPPYVTYYLNLLIQFKKYNTAKKFLKKTWKENPHPDYKKVIISLAAYLEINLVDLTKFIVGNSNTDISKIIMVEAYIISKEWKNARIQIKDLLDIEPKKLICMLMAKIEEGDTADIQKINSWKLRARNGKLEDIWVCMISKKLQTEWSSVSEGGYFNSLEWRQPFMLDDYTNTNNSLIYDN